METTGCVYKIVNLITDEKYIGQTTQTLENRWKQHIKDSRKKRYEKRPLYQAIKKYGIENFKIEKIEDCSTEKLHKREKYWIEVYDTFHNGYNVTMGGAGKKTIEDEEIIKEYSEKQNIRDVAKKYKISVDAVSAILIHNNIPIKPMVEVNVDKFGTKIDMHTKEGQYIKSFRSAREAARTIKPDTKNIDGVAVQIMRVCKGERQTAYGYVWKFSENCEK